MAKQILIVEGDADLSSQLKAELELLGFAVEETDDGKGSIERARGQRPDLLLLAVELPAGQNGYILCGKLKKDPDLKDIPVILMGRPDGFAQHRKLKTRADEYAAKPVNISEVVEKVGDLIGMPEVEGATTALSDENLVASEFSGDEFLQSEDIALHVEEELVQPESEPSQPNLDEYSEASLIAPEPHAESPLTASELPEPSFAETSEALTQPLSAPLQRDERWPESPQEDELQQLRRDKEALEQQLQLTRGELQQVSTQLSTAKFESESSRRTAEQAARQAQELQQRLSRALEELEQAKGRLATQATEADELSAPLKGRIAELEDSSARNEQRLAKLYQRMKTDEKIREKTKKALSIALQLLEEHSKTEEEKEPAAA